MKPAARADIGGEIHRGAMLGSPASIALGSARLPLLIVSLGVALLLLARLTRWEHRTDRLPAGPEPAPLLPDPPPPMDAGAASDAGSGIVSTWNDIAGLPYSQRDIFLADLRSLQMQLDSQNPLPAHSPPTEAQREAREQLRQAFMELNNATPYTWETCKQRMGDAWRQLVAADQDAQAHRRG